MVLFFVFNKLITSNLVLYKLQILFSINTLIIFYYYILLQLYLLIILIHNGIKKSRKLKNNIPNKIIMIITIKIILLTK